jgi:hypothetical protein
MIVRYVVEQMVPCVVCTTFAFLRPVTSEGNANLDTRVQAKSHMASLARMQSFREPKYRVSWSHEESTNLGIRSSPRS